MSDKKLTNEEFLLIARDLELHHAIFSKIWNVGKPRFTDKIPTACVTFDKEGNHLDFQFNPVFWDSLTPYERNFVICHECLHIMLSHGVRLKELNKDFGNIAADVVINEMLLSKPKLLTSISLITTSAAIFPRSLFSSFNLTP